MAKYFDRISGIETPHNDKDFLFKEFRKDGFPLCPNCGEDELYSKLRRFLDDSPTLQDLIDAGMECYACGWSNEPPIIHQGSRETVTI